MALKNIQVPTYDTKYKVNVQMQYANDEKLFQNETSFMRNVEKIAERYIGTMKAFGTAGVEVLEGRSSLGEDEQKWILTAIGGLYKLPSFSALKKAYQNLTIADYVLLIRAKQALKRFDGTNKGYYDIIKTLFDMDLVVEDNCDMTVDIYWKSSYISSTLTNIINNSDIFPKVAGVNVTMHYNAYNASHWNFEKGTSSVDTPGIIADEDPTKIGSWGETTYKYEEGAE